MDAISPRRRRMTASAARERSSHVLDGAKLVRTRTCTNYIHIPFFIKVLRSFFKSDRSLVPPRSPSKRPHLHQIDGGSVPGAAPERSPADLDGAKLVRTRTCTNSIHPLPLIKVLRSFFKSDRSPVSLVPRLPSFPTKLLL